ncbi:helix-turn-helix domain-containing protein [Curtobacterium sp. B8]|uniref:helix-turn-helix domain-containing protein n=1 Tax=Curtobacterium sp. B8 TaxID=95611 RepID=UPI0003453C95|nr:helix-turn-helix domain-containing protein [Curtobacterium sp. B8]
MTTPTPPRRIGKPRRTVTDEARAEQLLEELRQAEVLIREATARRRELALEAHTIGLTTTKIGEAVGVSQTAVSKWVRAAREQIPQD